MKTRITYSSLSKNKLKSLLSFLSLFLIVLPGFSQCPQLVWQDEFETSSLDLNKWTPQLGDGCDIGLCGWGNNELEYYTDKSTNISVTNGNLVITARKERVQSKQYTSGRIRTINKGDWTYGRMEAKMKLPVGQGMWPAFWMLSTDEVYGGWPQSGEIDIMENKGSEPNIVYGTAHYGDPYPNNKSAGGKYTLPAGSFNDAFHVFAVEWETTQIRWYVDGILFATKTNNDISPWPFDQRFHILLNLAVGGNFGGDPNSSTVFPQSLYVDYVRVYASKLPYITGPDQVSANQTNITYSVTASGGASYNWTVPSGAVIKSGQGTSSITVDWGTADGPVNVTISQSCGTYTYSKNIYVKPPVSYGFTFENYDDQRHLTYLSSDGTYQQAISNPNPSGINTSAKVASYTRNSAIQYDVLNYGVTQITDASQYSLRKKKFFLDVYTSAPIGTLIFIQLENSSTATASNFPTGRHSRYVAFTSKQNQWERLEFELDAILDTSVPNNGVDRLLILYNSNSFTGDLYYMDNLDSYNVGTVSSGDTQAPSAPANLTSNSITDNSVGLSWTASTDNVGVTGYDIFKDGALAGSATQTSFTVSGLTSGTTYSFTVKAKDAAGNLSAASNALSVTTSAPVSYIKIEAENYSNMKGISIESCSDTDGGSDVTSIDKRDYMDYIINVPASGTYRLDFRVASSVSTAKFDFKKGNTVISSLTVPNTGGGQVWQTISSQATLSAGSQTFRVFCNSPGFNLNWIGLALNNGARIVPDENLISNDVVLKVFPNPTLEMVNIHSPEKIEEVSIIGNLGLAKKIYPMSQTTQIHLGDLKKGVYILKIRTSNGLTSKKIIVD